jgi:hypothetical protein
VCRQEHSIFYLQCGCLFIHRPHRLADYCEVLSRNREITFPQSRPWDPKQAAEYLASLTESNASVNLLQ